jgi:predicted transcriptional regulator YdeE
MFEIIKVYRQSIEPSKFIGKKYDDADRFNGLFQVKPLWDKWYKLGWFETIENQIKMHTNDFYDEGNAHIGLWENKSGEEFHYWIGMFTPESTFVPEGYDYVDFPKSELGVCWVYGKEQTIFMNDGIEIMNRCNELLKKEGMSHKHDKNDTCWAFERYTNSRSKKPDDNGNIILDICFYMDFLY